MIYLDTSILVAYYDPDALSVEAERLVRAHVRPSISDLTEVELVSAVSRKIRASELDLREAGRIVGQFLAHPKETSTIACRSSAATTSQCATG